MAFYEHSCERESPSPSLLSLTFYSPYSALCVCHLFRLFVRLQSLTRMFTHSLPVSIPSFHSFIHSSSRLHVCRCSISFCWPVFPPSRLFQNAPNSGATRPIAPTYPDSNRQILKFPEKNWFLAKFPFLLWFRNFHWWSHRVFLWWRNVIRSLLKCCMSHAEWREISPHFESLNHFNHSNHPLFGSWNSAKPPFPPIQYLFPASFFRPLRPFALSHPWGFCPAFSPRKELFHLRVASRRFFDNSDKNSWEFWLSSYWI